jgi:hypothetical protein
MAGTAAKQPKPPAGRELDVLLGKAAAHWAALLAALAESCGPLVEKWTYSDKTGRWLLRLEHTKRKRTVLYLTPCAGHFLAAFALGERACRAARAAGLPAAALAAIDAAPRYPEGRGVRLAVRSRRAAESVAKLAAVKLAN